MQQFLYWLLTMTLLALAFDKIVSLEIEYAEQMQDAGDDYLRGVHDN